jgi:hypothetical protein
MTPWPLSPRANPDLPPVRRDTGPGAEGWRDTAPGDLSRWGWLVVVAGVIALASVGAFVLLTVGWLVRGWMR